MGALQDARALVLDRGGPRRRRRVFCAAAGRGARARLRAAGRASVRGAAAAYRGPCRRLRWRAAGRRGALLFWLPGHAVRCCSLPTAVGSPSASENIHIEALSSTLMRLEPLCLHAPARRTVDAVHPMLEACTSPQYSFMRRLLVYAATLDFLRAASASACRLMELEFPSLATLFSRMARDIARCCEFAKLLCRMVVPSRILESKWLLHLSHNTVAACAIALPVRASLQQSAQPLTRAEPVPTA